MLNPTHFAGIFFLANCVCTLGQLPTISIQLANGRDEIVVTEGSVIPIRLSSSIPVKPLGNFGSFKATVEVSGKNIVKGIDFREFLSGPVAELGWIPKGKRTSPQVPIVIKRDSLKETTEVLVIRLVSRDKVYRINPKRSQVTIRIRDSGKTASSAASLSVPTHADTIRHALLVAADGDTVMVGPGIYHESDLRFRGKEILITGTRRAGQLLTTIDAQRKACHFNIGQGEGRSLIIRDFILVNGSGRGTFNGVRKINMAGSIHITGASPTILSNLFLSNSTAFGADIAPVDSLTGFQKGGQSGGAIFVGQNTNYPTSNPLIRGNQFTANNASANGAAIGILDANAQIQSNVFTSNKANLSGGAISIVSPRGGPTDILRNIFTANQAEGKGDVRNSGGGGAITVSCGSQQPSGVSDTCTISGNQFLANRCRFAGGAIGVFGVNCSIVDNAIVGNYGGEYGGGIHIETQAKSGGNRKFLIESNTILSNSCRYVGGGIHPFFEDTETTAVIRTNVISHNSAIHPTATIATIPADDKTTGGGNIGRAGGIGSLGGRGLLTITDNVISKNIAQQESAVWITECPVVIVNNTINENTAVFRNGAVFLNQSPTMHFASNQLISNRVTTDWSQIASAQNLDEDRAPLYIAGPTNGGAKVTIGTNIFIDNSGYKAGALFLMRSPNAQIVGNIFDGNKTLHSLPNSGGTIFNDKQPLTISSNTFRGDRWGIFNQSAVAGMVISDNLFLSQAFGLYRAPGFGSALSSGSLNAGVTTNHPAGTFAGNTEAP